MKLQAICYAVLVIVGEYNFNVLMKNLADFIKQSNERDSANEAITDKLRQGRSGESAATAERAKPAAQAKRAKPPGQAKPQSPVPANVS